MRTKKGATRHRKRSPCPAPEQPSSAGIREANPRRGRVGVVIDNGCLARGGKEKSTHAGVVKADLLGAVVLLPAKLLYNTGAPGAVLFFNKRKPSARKGKVLSINASGEIEGYLKEFEYV